MMANSSQFYYVPEVNGVPVVLDDDPRLDGGEGTAATVAVGTTMTGAPGTEAAVTNAGTSSAAVLDFVIPRGDPGNDGAKGDKGDKGDPGDPATNLVTSVAGRQGAVVLTAADVGLANVNNTSDANKPVSTAQAAADALKLDKAGGTVTGPLTVSANLTMQGTVLGFPTVVGGEAYRAYRSGEPQRRFAVNDIGSVSWGDGTTPSLDTNLYRGAADTLKTDDSFVVGGNLSVTGTTTFTGAPSGPTAAAGTNTTQLATTAFVNNAVASGSGGSSASSAGFQPWGGNRYFCQPTNLGAYDPVNQFVGASAGYSFFFPVWVPNACTLASMLIGIKSASAITVAVALYGDNPAATSGGPAARLFQTSVGSSSTFQHVGPTVNLVIDAPRLIWVSTYSNALQYNLGGTPVAYMLNNFLIKGQVPATSGAGSQLLYFAGAQPVDASSTAMTVLAGSVTPTFFFRAT